MPTLHLHRLLLVAPVARHATINARVKANLDPEGGDWLTGTLSASGSPPATHGWFCAALKPSDLKDFMQALCSAASLTPPANWDSLNRQQRKQWFLDQRNAIRTATGIRLMLADNDAAWDSPEALLAAAGLQTIGNGA